MKRQEEWRDGRPRPSQIRLQRKAADRGSAWTGEGARLSIASSDGLVRWLKFNAVGGIGIAVQLAALAFFRSALRLDYRVATGLAVETAVIHNFLWHERFTWADRPAQRFAHSLSRLARFNTSNGLVSLLGNLLIMRVLVGQFHLHYVIANLVAVTTCSIVNFLVSDRFVFES